MDDKTNDPTFQALPGDPLAAAVTRALEQPPEITIPESFAARVREALPAQTEMRRQTNVAPTVGMGAAAAALVALCWLAPHSTPNFQSMAFDVELALLAEVAAIAAWLARRREGS
jgi:hypothetical protein